MLNSYAWHAAQLPEAVSLLAQTLQADAPVLSNELVYNEELNQWLAWAGGQLACEFHEVNCPAAELSTLLKKASPALIRYQDLSGEHFLLMVGSKGKKLSLLTPNGHQQLTLAQVHTALTDSCVSSVQQEMEAVLDLLTVSKSKRQQIEERLRQERLAQVTVAGIWLLRLPPETSFWQQITQQGLLKTLSAIALVFFGLYSLEILSWFFIGQTALQGEISAGWLIGWLLLVLSLLPIKLLGQWLNGSFSIRLATLLKRRLLVGAMALAPDTIRGQGIGQLLGQVIEAETFEELALNSGLNLPVTLIEFLLAALIFTVAVNSWLHTLLLLLFLGTAFFLNKQLYQNMRDWTQSRLNMAHQLVEQMVGHRSRLVQQTPEHWHDQEDSELQHYYRTALSFDQSKVRLLGLIPRAWLFASLLALLPSLLNEQPQTTTLAILLGGVLLSFRAFSEYSMHALSFVQTLVAWQQISPIFKAAQSQASPVRYHQSDSNNAGHLIEAINLQFRYRPEQTTILKNCNFHIQQNDRILLQGASGGGKSTLSALLSATRNPDSGFILLQGLDLAAWGQYAWRKQIAYAPQFNDNFIFSAPLAFNLLMGRTWPPSTTDLQQAETLCIDLGLAELLQRMPAGIMQMVGETGWRLSHGERSRIYLARALLQNPKLVILDESFGALDPENLARCLNLVLNTAPALLVIAHP